MKHGMMALILTGFAIRSYAWEAGWSDELTPIYPDRPVAGEPAQWETDVPREGIAETHVLISGIPEGAVLSVEAPDDVRVFRLVAVPVEENTGLDSRTERFTGQTNPHVIRRAPFRIFEALEPIRDRVTSDGSTLALRVEIPIPPAADPGELEREVVLREGAEARRLTLRVRVYAATVPPLADQHYGYVNWHSSSKIASAHRVEPWSEEFWAVMDRYAAMMARGRQNMVLLSLNDMFSRRPDGTWQLEKDRLHRYVRTFERHGVTQLAGGHLAGRTGGRWEASTLDLILGGGRTEGPQADARLDEILLPLAREIREQGWASRWLQHIADEPTGGLLAPYRALVEEVRRRLPEGVRIFEATMTRALDGTVDVWCPQIQEYESHRDFFDGQMAQGRGVWVYTCLTPGGPHLNRLLDQERLRPVYLGWSLSKYNLRGFLHWGGTYWTDDPFGVSVRQHAPENPNNRLPAGDSHIWYPGPKGPWSSTRFEAHRIGMEDAELLRRLQAVRPELHAALMNQQLRTYTDFNKDVRVYREARRVMLSALSEPASEAH